MVYEFGQFPYGLSPTQFIDSGSTSTHAVEVDGYDHLIINQGEGRITVVSRPVAGYLSFITLFSWLFAFFGTISFLIVQARHLLSGTTSAFSLTRRVRTSVIALVVFAFLATGAVTVFYILRKYDNDQRRNIGEQLSGLWVLLGDRLGLGTPFSELKPGWLSDELGQIVSSTNIDFNLYDEKGRLFFSSRPRLHEQGIVSDRMDPEAFHELNEFGKTQFIHREAVGSLIHMAAYAPFIGPGGETTGYLHLPYFEKQYERSREVSGFLSALFNIYILLLAVAVFVAAFISSRVTRPLAIIQERLSVIRFGGKNETIVYAVNDEIGQLVQEYNRMVQELADSADKLARSERESAWREMAKQVAHEIKNPLTPMRLSIQQLQHVWAEQADNREELTKHMSKVLLEQIDTLSHIATEFSNFAKMPVAVPSPVDLREIITSSISLFSQSYPHEFRFNSPMRSFVISADKDQLKRIFSNLLKNAVQAVPDDRKGIIEVRLSRDTVGFIRIDIEDNGKGIPEENRSRIFVPNFTTKSGGTGLGLAMVKNIVEQGGGSVSFQSKHGEGTVFTILWPEAEGIV
ncbi:MAG: sensor histidine kinase [Bacteroidota bacterium]